MATEQNMERRIEIRLNRSEVTSYLSSMHRITGIEVPEGTVTIKSELRNETELMSDIVKTESSNNPDQEVANGHGHVKGFNCPRCQLTFKHRLHLNHHQSTNQRCSVQSNHSGDVKLDKESSSHQCPQCNKCFKSKSFLRGHMVVHSGKKRFQCRICDESLSSCSSLSKHMKIHERYAGMEAQRTHSCPKCKKEFRRYISLRLHMAVHLNVPNMPYICPTCLVRFKNKVNFNRHTRKKHLFKCEHCELAFPHKTKLDGHVFTYHRGINLDDIDERGTNVSRRSLSCPQCKAIFTRRDGLRSHMKVHTEEMPYRCSKCPKTFKWRSTLHAHTQKEHCVTKVKHSCPECKKEFKTSCNLRRHMAIHSEKPRKPYFCSTCHERFKLESNFNSHTRKEHLFKCEHCELAFPHKTKLNGHVGKWHRERMVNRRDGIYNEGDKKGIAVSGKGFSCPECKKEFRASYNLRRHMTIHSEKPHKPYFCTTCHERFKNEDNFNRHTQKEHLFKCEHCELAFPHKQNLDAHMSKCHRIRMVNKGDDDKKEMALAGKKFYCPVCKKLFENFAHLQSHIVVHSNEKLYVCTTCLLDFKSEQDLNCHTQKEHLFQCEHCELSFHNKSGHEVHILNCHTEKITKSYQVTSIKDDKYGTSVGQLMYACPVCKKAFATADRLRGHKAAHSDERSYVCPTCSKAFKWNCSLQKHTRKQHAINYNGNSEVMNRVASVEEVSDPLAVVLTIKEEQRSEDDFPIILKTESLLDGTDPEVVIRGKGFQCPTCQLTFKYRLHLTHHLTTNEGCTIQHNQNNDVKLF